jgi:hypothetical protein
MTELFTTNLEYIVGIAIVVVAGGYGAYAWFQRKWPFDTLT